jgi:hypothetical protein
MPGARAGERPGVADDAAQRGPVEVVHVRVGDQHPVHRRQFGNVHAGDAQPLDQNQPVGEVGINQQPLPGHLQQKSRMAEKRQPQIAAARRRRIMRIATAFLPQGLAQYPEKTRCSPLYKGTSIHALVIKTLAARNATHVWGRLAIFRSKDLAYAVLESISMTFGICGLEICSQKL